MEVTQNDVEIKCFTLEFGISSPKFASFSRATPQLLTILKSAQQKPTADTRFGTKTLEHAKQRVFSDSSPRFLSLHILVILKKTRGNIVEMRYLL